MLVLENFSLIHDEKCEQMLKYIARDSPEVVVVAILCNIKFEPEFVNTAPPKIPTRHY